MSTVTPPPPATPAPPGPSPAATAAASVGAPASGDRVPSWSTATTPGWYRVQAVLVVAVLTLLAVIGVVAAIVLRSSTGTVRDEVAPSLIAVQGLSAAVAEANSNATAAFLATTTGAEDRQRRVAYLEARARSAEQLEQVASLIGDDPEGHRDLQDVAVALTDYSGTIEASRTAALAGDDAAVDDLRAALDLTGTEVAASVAAVTAAGQDAFDERSAAGRLWTIGAVLVGLAALALLGWIQFRMVALTNRLVNPGLAAATLLVAATVVWTLAGSGARGSALANADDGGYQAIVTTSRLQAAANEVQTGLSLRLLGDRDRAGISEPLDRLVADAEILAAGADSTREEAAAQALQVRLDRYRAATVTITDLADRGATDEAVAAFQGEGLSTFNGLNTSIEAVLSDNRRQFTDGVDGAADAVRWLPFVAVALPALAALAAVAGIQRRLGEYS